MSAYVTFDEFHLILLVPMDLEDGASEAIKSAFRESKFPLRASAGSPAGLSPRPRVRSGSRTALRLSCSDSFYLVDLASSAISFPSRDIFTLSHTNERMYHSRSRPMMPRPRALQV